MMPLQTGPKSERSRPKSSAWQARGWAQTKTRIQEKKQQHPDSGNPFRLTAEGRLHVAVDLQELLTNQGIPDTWPSDSWRRRIRKQ